MKNINQLEKEKEKLTNEVIDLENQLKNTKDSSLIQKLKDNIDLLNNQIKDLDEEIEKIRHNQANLQIDVYDKDKGEEREHMENERLQREKLEEEFYDFFKQEKEEYERKQVEEEEKRQKEYEDRLREERERIEREEEEIKANEKQYMEKIISLMKEGKSRHEAAKEAGVRITIVDDWFFKGFNSVNEDYKYFYTTIINIENKNKSNNSRNNAGTNSRRNKKIKCRHCGKYNDSDSKFCSHCGRLIDEINDSEINFCENCGTKITDDCLNYCINCGYHIRENENNVKSTTRTKPKSSTKKGDSASSNVNTSNNQFDGAFCCVLVIIVFLAFVFITSII